jgi:hypothetical protein
MKGVVSDVVMALFLSPVRALGYDGGTLVASMADVAYAGALSMLSGRLCRRITGASRQIGMP